MGEITGAVTRLIVSSCVAALAVGATVADAGRIALPATRYHVELPSGFKVQAVTSGVDVLEWNSGTVFVGSAGTCAEWLQLFDGLSSSSHQSFSPSYLPSGWSGYEAVGSSERHVTACRERGTAVWAYWGWPPDSDSDAALGSLLSALETGEQPNYLTLLEEVVTLPGTGWNTIPGALRLERSDVADRRDDFADEGDSGAVELKLWRRSGDCAQVAATLAPSAIISNDNWAGGRRFELADGQHTMICMPVGNELAISLEPSSAAASAAGYLSITGRIVDEVIKEQTDPAFAGTPTTLPTTQLKLRMPGDFAVSTENPKAGVDRVEGHGGFAGLEISTPSAACSSLIQVNDGPFFKVEAFRPAWLGPEWTAAGAVAAGTNFCATVNGKSVYVSGDALGTITRRELQGILQSLVADNAPAYVPTPETPTDNTVIDNGGNVTPYVPSPSRGPRIPLPLELALQTTSVNGDRGWGVRGGTRLARPLSETLWIALAGDVGYDGETRLSWDVHAAAEYRLGEALGAGFRLGRDTWGSALARPTIAPSTYWGLSAALHLPFGDGRGLDVEGVYMKRMVGDAPMTEVAPGTWALEHPGKEYRLRIDWGRASERLPAYTFEVRDAGDTTSLLLGARLRL